MSILRNLYYSFPFQLFLLQLKKQQLLLLFWVVLFGIVTKTFAKKFGVPYLFLDPEYLGSVDFTSFLFVGVMFGAFAMSWNITMYILHAFRFPFLATLEKPFAKFCMNNSVLPGMFIIVYGIEVVAFQSVNEFRPISDILFQFSGFLVGFILVLFISFTYFMSTNKSIFKLFGVEPREPKQKRRKVIMKSDLGWENVKQGKKTIEVRYYLNHPFSIRRVRSVSHYDTSMISFVFRNHHLNALAFELIALGVVVALGLLIELPEFRIPAGSSILLIAAILVMFFGAFSFWLRGWRTTVFIGLFLLLNFLIRFEVFDSHSKAYGVDYSKAKVSYTTASLKSLISNKQLKEDKSATYAMLNNWLKKNTQEPAKQPRLVMVSTTGGGSRSAAWTYHVLQQVDSILGGELFEHTFMINGASAGLIGAAYYRELKYQEQVTGEPEDYKEHYENISRDILNPVVYSLFVNDVFFPLRSFELNGNEYYKDRGFMFERQINENTDFIMDKRVMDYQEAEQNMDIPMMVISPTITNDGRKLLISAQGISYLTKPAEVHSTYAASEIDGVEFMRMFKDHSASELRFSSALRMNATFPYITPNVVLPTLPPMEVMDAGMRDNFGLGTTIRFINIFKDWLSTFTGGVVIIQIRDSGKQTYIEPNTGQSFVDRLLNPIGNFYQNWDEFQDYHNDNLIDYASEWLDGRLDVVPFEYIPTSLNEAASLSWHLTTREKENIRSAINSNHNQESIKYLTRLFGK